MLAQKISANGIIRRQFLSENGAAIGCAAASPTLSRIAPTITGTLLSGYGAVELVNHLTGYNKATGDLFTVIAPLGLALGRGHRLQRQLFHVYLIV